MRMRWLKGMLAMAVVTAMLVTALAWLDVFASVREARTRSRGYLTRAEIGALVERNRTLILAGMRSGKYGEIRQLPGVQDVHTGWGFVDVDCGGWGMVSEGGYVGFYWSWDGEAVDCARMYPWMPLEDMACAQVDGGWMWTQQTGDDAYLTVPLGDELWYYEAKF